MVTKSSVTARPGRAPIDRLSKVEAAQAEAANAGETTLEFNGMTFTVLAVGSWRSSAMKDLRNGDLSTWAEKCLTPESAQAWEDWDPTLDEAGAFMQAWQDAIGENVGK